MLLSRSAGQQPKGPAQSSNGMDNGMEDLQARVEKMVHKAFWDEALEALNSSDVSTQIHRLHRLYADVYEAIKAMLPPDNRVLSVLSAPYPPPSISPLHTTIALLRDVLLALKERCAPIRDDKIEDILAGLDRAPPYSAADSLHPEQRAEHQSLLSRIVITAIQEIVSLAQDMKSDLTQTVLGVMTEEQIRHIVTEQARVRERDLILTLMSKETVEEAWISWLSQRSEHIKSVAPGLPAWIARLLDALSANVPVAANVIQYIAQAPEATKSPPPPPLNNLPPPFFFCAPDLFQLQNHLQALVIVASLRSLVPIPQHANASHPASPSQAAPSSSPHAPSSNDLTHRLWTLLEAEIKPEHAASASAGETKIINLADEVLRARKQAGDAAPEGDSEARVRAAVERTLRAEDPVFALLQRRVVEWLAHALSASPPARPVAPERMRTGRRVVEGGRVDEEEEEVGRGLPPPPKGFEDAVLVAALRDAVRMLQTRCVQWVRSMWGDVVEV
ncbi:hypothetical protein HDZ31DRAFT_28850 [Schizophyllum fasciatum]